MNEVTGKAKAPRKTYAWAVAHYEPIVAKLNMQVVEAEVSMVNWKMVAILLAVVEAVIIFVAILR